MMKTIFSRGLTLGIVSALALGCPAGPVVVTPTVGQNGSLDLQPPGPYQVGTRVTLTATPAVGYVVDSWSGTDDDASKSPINHVTITDHQKPVSVSFVLATGGPFHLTLPGSVANGSLTGSPTEPAGGYAAGTVVTLTATPVSGYALDAWTGTDDDSSASLTNQVTLSSDRNVGVTFKVSPGGGGPTYLLTLSTTGNVSLAASSSNPTQAGPSYIANTVVTLTATVAQGHKVTWTHTDNDTLTTATNTVTIHTTPVTVTAASVCDTTCTLTVLVDDPAFGHVTIHDPGSNLTQQSSGSTSTVEIVVGHVVTLTAHDTVNWPFQGWSSPVSPSNTCTGTVTLSTDQTASASFPDVPASAAVCP